MIKFYLKLKTLFKLNSSVKFPTIIKFIFLQFFTILLSCFKFFLVSFDVIDKTILVPFLKFFKTLNFELYFDFLFLKLIILGITDIFFKLINKFFEISSFVKLDGTMILKNFFIKIKFISR